MGRPQIWESDADRKADYRWRKRKLSELTYLSKEAEKMRAYRGRLKGDTGPGSYAYDWEVKKLCDLCISTRRKRGQRHRDDRLGWWVSSMLGEIEQAMIESKKLVPGLAPELNALLDHNQHVCWHYPLDANNLGPYHLEQACLFEDVEDRLNQLMGRKRAVAKPELNGLPGYVKYRRKRKRTGARYVPLTPFV